MSRRHVPVGLGVAVLLCLPGLAHAQGNPIELGIDASINRSISDPSATTVLLPTGPLGGALITGANKSFRVGFFLSPTVSIEPAVSFILIDPEGEGSSRVLGLGLGALFHFSGDPAGTQGYVRPFVGFDQFKSSGSDAENIISVGAGIGVKLPVAKQLKARLEVAYVHGFENSDAFIPAQDIISFLFGFSFYTK